MTFIDKYLDAVDWKPVDPPKDYDGPLPFATHEGVMQIGGASFRVTKLNTGERIINSEDFEKFFEGDVLK